MHGHGQRPARPNANERLLFLLYIFQDFGDGGAYPEIAVAQYPLNMGIKGQETTSNALAIQLDNDGKIKYDVLARQGHGKDKVSFLLYNLYIVM